MNKKVTSPTTDIILLSVALVLSLILLRNVLTFNSYRECPVNFAETQLNLGVGEYKLY